MRNSLSFKNLSFKKMFLKYSEHSALVIYFALYKYKIFLFAQKSQLMLKFLLQLLINLSLSLSYLVISASFIKLLFKLVGCLNFLFRELLMVFFNSDLLVRDLLISDVVSKSIVFFCYNNFFLNTKFLPAIGKFVGLFSRNFSAFKVNTSFALYCVTYYAISITNQKTS